ncbi:MAG: hypothetical protein N4A46_11830 [Schleiferiaceae bacterium]|nr:hypothetical protein [Schleiferiaceae bacterium]
MKKNTILLFFLVGLQASLTARKIDFINVYDHNAWEEIIKLCQKKNIPLLVLYSYDKSNAGNLEAFQKKGSNTKYANTHFVPVYVHPNSKLGKTLTSMFLLEQQEYFLVFNAQEIILNRASKITLKWLEECVRRYNEYSSLMKDYYNRDLGKWQWIDFLEIEFYNKGYFETIRLANRFVPQLEEKDLSNPKTWPYIYFLAIDVNNPIFNTIRKNKALVESDAEEFSWKKYYVNAYNLNLSLAIENKDTSRLFKTVDYLVPLFPDSTERNEQKLLIQQQYYGALNQWKNYKELTLNYLTEQDSSELYVEEYEKVIGQYNYAQARKPGTAFLEAGMENSPSYKTAIALSEMYLNTGDTDLAYSMAKRAYKLAETAQQQIESAMLIEYLSR